MVSVARTAAIETLEADFEAFRVILYRGLSVLGQSQGRWGE